MSELPDETAQEKQALDDLVRGSIMYHASLKLNGRLSEGERTAILCSGANLRGKYSKEDSETQFRIGKKYASKIENSFLIRNAKIQDFADALFNYEVKNIIAIGHSTFSVFVATDGYIDWADIHSWELDHLKSGFFMKAGCNPQIQEAPSAKVNGADIYFPFGFNFMKNWGRIYIPQMDLAYESQLKDPSQYCSWFKGNRSLQQELRQISR